MRPHPATFTVPEGLVAIGRVCYAHKCQWIGAEMGRRVRRRNQWRELPIRLNKKTYGNGTHGFVPHPDESLYRALFLEVVLHYERLFGEGPVAQPDLVLQPELFSGVRSGVEVDLKLEGNGDGDGVDVDIRL